MRQPEPPQRPPDGDGRHPGAQPVAVLGGRPVGVGLILMLWATLRTLHALTPRPRGDEIVELSRADRAV